MSQNSPSISQTEPRSELTTFESTIGYVLAFSYPFLALATGVRSLYQLFFKAGVTDYLPAILSGVAALCYLLAAVGFVVRARWAWWLSVSVLGFETSMSLIVGILSFVQPDLVGHTVWRHFGADYGFFPFVQPILGLIWLTRPPIMRAYGIRQR